MRDIGIDVKMPSGDWDGDENCPFNGSLRLRGQLFEGVVSSVGMSKSIIVELQKVRYMPKYERYEKRTSKIPAHLPSCIGELNGEVPTIGEGVDCLVAKDCVVKHSATLLHQNPSSICLLVTHGHSNSTRFFSAIFFQSLLKLSIHCTRNRLAS